MRVRLSEDAEAALIRAAGEAVPREAGGVLVGVRIDGEPWVVTIVQVRGPASGSAFEIPRGATSIAVELARKRDARLGYIGDWHSHLADVGPSLRDLRSLRELAYNALHGPRVMALVRETPDGWSVEIWEPRGFLRRARPCQVVRSGPLRS